jgi:hypothetical protein
MSDRRTVLAVLEVVLLAFWLGAATLFATVVAPAAFAALPSRTLAGAVVGKVLPTVFSTGMLVGIVVFTIDLLDRTRGGGWTRPVLAGVTALACAVAQFGYSGRIAALRTAVGGPIDALAPDDPRRVAFGRLHAMSVAWLGVAMVAATIGLVLAARAFARTEPDARASTDHLTTAPVATHLLDSNG